MENKRMDMQKRNVHTENEKISAAYALNMCTVSVSQIVDYNDVYIMEQEYNAILNNLNLRNIPKDEALLNILTEILNTITYFRIQNIKKDQIEKRYQRQVKDAIWSAVPSLSVIVSGNPVSMAVAIATQVGTGYMNYRKAKSNAGVEKEDAEIELEITAIEQFNALKRELFTTAWRLADEYEFDDDWRLTELQIKQYDEILMDNNIYRKYARLESVQDKFKAYPPFWYYFGHAANCIAELESDVRVKKQYREYAKDHFDYFYEMSKYSILRYDQISASCALEYVDILASEEDKNIEKITELLNLAVSMGGNSLDVLQLCAISYLKIGGTDQAASILKSLVNEEYNVSANAKLLSRLYVSQYINSKDLKKAEEGYTEYQILSKVCGETHLFPMPESYPSDSDKEDNQLQNKYIEDQIRTLKKEYRMAIIEFIKIYIVEFNKLLPMPENSIIDENIYYADTVDAKDIRENSVHKALSGKEKENYIYELKNCALRTRCINLLNKMLSELDELMLFKDYEDKDLLIDMTIKRKLIATKKDQRQFQEKLEKKQITFDDYKKLQDEISFRNLTENFFDKLRKIVDELLDASYTSEAQIKYLETAETDLVEFRKNHHLTDQDNKLTTAGGINKQIHYYLDYRLLGDDVENEGDFEKKLTEMKDIVKKAAEGLINDSEQKVKVLLPGTAGFNGYFANENLREKLAKSEILGILDDITRKDKDLILKSNGVAILRKNSVEAEAEYKDIKMSKSSGKTELKIGWLAEYSNNNVDMDELYELIKSLEKV